MHTRLIHIIHKFSRKQQGGVTVDWVFLTAAVISLSAVIMITIGRGESEISDTMTKSMASSQEAFPQE